LTVHAVPLVDPLSARQPTVKHGNVMTETGVNAGEQLWGQGDFRHQIDHLFPLSQRRRHGAHVDFGLAATGDTVQQHGGELPPVQERLYTVQGLALRRGERDIAFVEEGLFGGEVEPRGARPLHSGQQPLLR
jgi:hypothetical protein